MDLSKVFKSRTAWTLAAMFIIGGLNAVVPVLPAEMQTVLIGLLGVAATYFHVNPSQTYNQPK